MATAGSCFIDMTGQRFARLTVLGIDPSRPRGDGCKPYWICRCECGAIKSILGANLRSGRSKSCKCLRVPPLQTTHGDYGSPENRAWRSMIQRCTNPQVPQYANYGGRGIKVCQRWLHSYVNFLADMGRRPSPKHSLDRIDNSKEYSPDNCRWATAKDQANNFRANRLIAHGGVTLTVSQWADVIGVTRATIYQRLNHLRWTVGQALGFEPRPSKSPGS